MKARVFVLVFAIASAALSGCTPSRTDWFGNPVTSTPPGAVCPQRDVPEPEARTLPNVPGRNSMLVTTEVRARTYDDAKLTHERCVPFRFTMTGAVTGLDHLTLVPRDGSTPKPMPASGNGRTPWFADGLILWDLDQAPPMVSVHIEATYDAARDFAESAADAIVFRCAISYNGGPAVVIDIKPDARKAGFVRCDFEHLAIPRTL